MWLLEFPNASFGAELFKKPVEVMCRISAYEVNWGKESAYYGRSCISDSACIDYQRCV